MLSTGTYQGVQLPVVELPPHTQEVAAVRYRNDDDSNPGRVSVSGAYQSYPSGPTSSGPHGGSGPHSSPMSRGGFNSTPGTTGSVPALYPAQPGSHPSAPGASGSNPTGSGALHLTPGAAPVGASTSSKVVLAGIGIGVVAIGLGAVLFMGKAGDDPTTTPAASGAPVAPAPSSPAEKTTDRKADPPVAPSASSVTVRIEASPKSAKIFVDGKATGDNPHEAKFPKDGASHEIKVEADGYEAQTKTVVADKDTGLSIGLAPLVRRGGGGRPQPQPPPDDNSMKPNKPPTRNLDPTPY
jgi:hypothetical protein